jgi:phenylpropionate dioxygenase-like ring-hydroxylating dioxygenase large terminal subunit
MSAYDSLSPGPVAFRPDAASSAALPAHYYSDEGVFAREKDRIFYKSWQFAGYLSDLVEHGDYIATHILDQGIFVVRGREGRLRGFYNVCSHRGHELVAGKGRKRVITCPYHAWSFDTEGRLKAAGNADNVAGFDADAFCLSEVRVEALAHMVFVNLDARAPSLNDQAQGLVKEFRDAVPHFDDLKLARRDPFEVRSNWKLVIDNYLECYHCPHVHPGVMGTEDSYMEPSFETTEHAFYSTHIVRGNADVIARKKEHLPYDFTPDNVLQDVYLWWLWPNTMFMAHQGDANFQVFHVIPRSPTHTLEHVDNLCLTIPPSALDVGMMDNFRDVVQPQDIGVVESVQRGLRSRGFRRGRLMVDAERSWRSEHAVHHFDNLVWTALNGPNYA